MVESHELDDYLQLTNRQKCNRDDEHVIETTNMDLSQVVSDLKTSDSDSIQGKDVINLRQKYKSRKK